MKKVTITQARSQLPTLIKAAQKTSTEYVITINGSPAAVLISSDKYESHKETDEILADKKLMRAIRQGEKDIAEGRVSDWEDVKKELGWDV